MALASSSDAPSGFFAEDGLAESKGCLRDGRDGCPAGSDDHGLDAGIMDDVAPVSRGACKAERLPVPLRRLRAGRGDHFKPWPQACRENRSDRRHGDRMGLAHIAAAHNAEPICGKTKSSQTGLQALAKAVSCLVRRRNSPCAVDFRKQVRQGVLETIRLTVAQAIIRYLSNQFIEIDGEEMRLLRRRLRHFRPWQCHLPWRGFVSFPGRAAALSRPERAEHGLCRRAYAKITICAAASCSAPRAPAGTSKPADGGGTGPYQPPAAAAALRGYLHDKAADPVLQQIEHYGSPAIGLNDAFRAVSRYWDRITHPVADRSSRAACRRWRH